MTEVDLLCAALNRFTQGGPMAVPANLVYFGAAAQKQALVKALPILKPEHRKLAARMLCKLEK